MSLNSYLCPIIQTTNGDNAQSSNGNPLDLMANHPRGFKRAAAVHLDGNVARRKFPKLAQERCLWDDELVGFGLRIRPSGKRSWFVRLRQRSKHRRVTLGCTSKVDAAAARAQAKQLLSANALDGLPKRPVVRENPLLTAFVDAQWNDLCRVWKATTQLRNCNAWRLELAPVFGALGVTDIMPADVIRWRDSCAGDREAKFNRAVPVLGALLRYAEALNLRPKGSNPCRGLARYKRPKMERYLSPLEYGRMGAALSAAPAKHAAHVAIIRLLIYTGARISEVRDLRWEWVHEDRLLLPDSKTGPKTIWLNRQAVEILGQVQKRGDCPFVFPDKRGTRPLRIDAWWSSLRKRCAMPDLRIHDLRHSFASTAIMDNVPLATLGTLLGHLLAETTAKYAHLSDAVIADAAQRISGFLADALGLHP